MYNFFCVLTNKTNKNRLSSVFKKTKRIKHTNDILYFISVTGEDKRNNSYTL